MNARLAGGIFLFILLISVTLKGQWVKPEFDNIGIEEKNLKQCSFDKQADAVVLFDSGESFFIDGSNGIEMVFVKHIKIKILSEAGIGAASFQIPLYEGKSGIENLYNIKGFSYNFEGDLVRKTELKKDAVFKERINDQWSARRLTFPDVRVGTVVELEYMISSPYVFEFRDWDFQSQYPVIHSQYKTRMIPFYEYIYLIKGNIEKIQRKSYEDGFSRRGMFGIQFNEMVYEFWASELPGLVSERFAPSSKDYNTRVDFQLCTVIFPGGGKERILTTWEELIDDYLSDDLFGKYIKKAQKWGLKNLPVDSLLQLSEKERMGYVVDYVKRNYRTDGVLRWSRAKKSFNDFVKQRDGNAANLNLMTIGLLKAAGIDVVPVVLSTRLNGEIAYDYPFRHYFDCVVALVRSSGGTMILDATNPVAPLGELPLICYNGKGLIVEKGALQWCVLALPGHSVEATNFNLTFNGSDTVMTLAISSELTGFPATEWRDKLLQNPESVNQFFKNDLFNDKDLEVVVRNQSDIKLPLMFDGSLSIPVPKKSSRLIVRPFWGQSVAVNPFQSAERSLPIVIPYTGRRSFVFTMELPGNYKATQLPENKSLTIGGMSLQYVAALNDKKIVISGHYSVTKSFFAVAEYNEIRQFYNYLIKTFNQEVVVEPVQQ
ncbi:MAG: DUF3857 domain-containing protein [Bacteroidales bacterium]|nr:DUF3857 domain-containing protein [Bacteroidales bacterium]MDD3666320.1 DUF3857 domain-containing protein [Bacteroidales bacterium]